MKLFHFLPLLLLLAVGCNPPKKVVQPAADVPAIDRTVDLEDEPGVYRQTISIMGTVASVQFFDDDAKLNRKAAAAVWKAFDEVNNTFSNYNPESELSKLNLLAVDQPFSCSPLMWEMLMVSREAHRVSHGAFDITAGPIVKLWGIYRKTKETLPSQAEIDAVRAQVGFDKLIFDETKKTVQFAAKGMTLDVGGIAKGFAVDKAVEAVHALGIRIGIIDLGGNMYCLEEPKKGRDSYSIGVRNPFAPGSPEPVAIASMLGRAIATSGDYERYVTIDGKRYAHIMDVRTGKPVTGMAGVSVLASKAVVTDYLSTSIFINGGKYIDELRERHPELHVFIVRKPDGQPPTFQKIPDDSPSWAEVTPIQDWPGAPAE